MHLQPQVRGFVRRLADPWEPIDDAVAETYLTAWRRIEHLPPDDAAARSWLFTTARKVLANMRRRDAHQRHLAARLFGDRSARDDLVALPVDDRVELLDDVRSLPGEDRRTLWRVCVEGWTLERLARDLGCSYPAAAVRLHRARRRLREAIDR